VEIASPALIGREAEIEAAHRFLDGASGDPSAFLFQGEPGIGKTTLWREIVIAAECRGYRVLSSRPSQVETQLSYSALADLIAPAFPAIADLLPVPQRRALEMVLLEEDVHEAPPDPRAIAAALRSTLIVLAAQTPVMIAVDDLQWVDAATAVVLEYCLRRIDTCSVSLVATLRTEGEIGDLPLGLRRIIPAERLHGQPIGPMTIAALHELIRARYGRGFPRPTMVKIHGTSGGNPFFALEIARALLQEEVPLRPGDPLPVPASVRELVARRVSTLPRETQEVLRIVAADPRPQVALLRRLVGETALDLLAPAEEDRLIERNGDVITFSHPLFAGAVYASAPDPVRRELHRRLADASDTIESRARHLALATDQPDQEIALGLEAAARYADQRGAPTTAAELAEHALRLTPSGGSIERAMTAATYQFRAGDLSRARLLVQEALDTGPHGPIRAKALLLLAEILIDEHHSSQAAPLLNAALEETDDPSDLARVRGYLAFERNNAGDFRGCEPHARAALTHAKQAGDRAAIAEATAVLALVESVLGRGPDREAMTRALEMEDMDQGHGWLRPSLLVSFIEILSDRLPEARAVMERLYTRSVERGRDNELPSQLGTLVTICCWLGRTDLAESYVTESLMVARAEGGPARGAALYSAGLVAALRGRIDEARADLQQALGLLTENLAAFAQWTLAALGFICVSINDYEGADGLLSPMNAFVMASGVGEPRVWSFLPDEIEALLALGRGDEAEPLLTYLEERGAALDRPWALGVAARYRAMQLAAQNDLEQAMILADAAVMQHQRGPMPIDYARSLIAKGQIHRRRKERKAARAPLEKSLEMFEAMGMPLWSEKARAELARLGTRPAGSLDLTPTETRIARLAASGMTNRQVAETIFVSPKTVEANLVRVYRKLGIHSRAELGAKMHEGETDRPVVVS
jgi:DNA-binding CsgD family transcriptional regulator